MSTHHPSASEVSMGAGFTDFGPYRVRVNPFQNHMPQNKWEVLDREDTDGLRPVFDSFSTFRDAVRCAVSLHREWVRNCKPSMTEPLLVTIDDAIAFVLAAYHGPTPPLPLEDWSEFLWRLINASCKGHGVTVPKTLPEVWK